MSTIVKCNKCGNEIEISEALSKELEIKILKEIENKHKDEINQLLKIQELQNQQNKKDLEKIKEQSLKEAREQAIEQIRKEYDTKINSTKLESEERNKQNKELQKQLIENQAKQNEELTNLTKQLREAKNVESTLKLNFEKQLLETQEQIKQNAKKQAQDELSLILAQKDKQLFDVQNQLKDAQRKAEQVSQQLQGEVQELVLENQLKSTFIYDEIKEVPKGIKGADVIQIVKTNFGIECGTIVWESKNTKAWSNQWITKLKEDTRTLKADISILVSLVLPEGIKSFGKIQDIWVCDLQTVIPLAFALRDKIIAIKEVQNSNKGKETKAEIVYNYLTSNEFKQRIEIWVEYFKNRRDELEKEKAYFMKKWSKEDKNIMKVLQNTVGLYGDLQGLIGTSLPKVQYLELEGESEE